MSRKRRAFLTIDDFPSHEFRSTRSTVPLLSYWTHHDLPALLAGVLVERDLATATHRFEHATPVKNARGKASMTDLLLESSSVTAAIEAKWSEPPYPLVREWREQGTEHNRTKVLSHWLSHLRGYATPLPASDLGGVVYQSLHRTASACAAAAGTRRALVVYLVFDAQHVARYSDELRALATALQPDPDRLRLAVVDAACTPLAAHAELAQASFEKVRAKVRACELFTFKSPALAYDSAAAL